MRALLYDELAKNPEESHCGTRRVGQIVADAAPARTISAGQSGLRRSSRRVERRLRFGACLCCARNFRVAPVPGRLDAPRLVAQLAFFDGEDLRCKLGGPNLDRVKARVASEVEAVLQSADPAVLERFLAIYSAWPEAEAVRLRLAERLAAAGKLQQAELLLIHNERNGRPAGREAAERQLARLWDRAGLVEEAAELLLAQDNPRLNELPRDSLARLACQRLQEAGRPVGRVRVTQSLWEHCDHDLDDAYSNASRPFVMRPLSPFQLIDRGSSSPAEISIIDRLSGTIIDTLHVPNGYAGSTLAAVSQVGHFSPLGSRGALHGISLLEHNRQKPLWTTSPPAIAMDVDSALVGPSGPTFCVFQSHGHLFVLDPGTGRSSGSVAISIRNRVWGATRTAASSETAKYSWCWGRTISTTQSTERRRAGSFVKAGSTTSRDRRRNATPLAAASPTSRPTTRIAACESGIRSATGWCTNGRSRTGCFQRIRARTSWPSSRPIRRSRSSTAARALSGSPCACRRQRFRTPTSSGSFETTTATT